MADEETTPGRPSRPDEEPPRRRGGRFAWLVGTVPGIAAVAFIAITIVVILIVLLA
jgi:hypothetical protein